MSERQVRTGVSANETAEERAVRVQRLKKLVQAGAYGVNDLSLAQAIMAWEPNPGRPHPGFGTPNDGLAARAERHRTYMRAYMRRHRG